MKTEPTDQEKADAWQELFFKMAVILALLAILLRMWL